MGQLKRRCIRGDREIEAVDHTCEGQVDDLERELHPRARSPTGPEGEVLKMMAPGLHSGMAASEEPLGSKLARVGPQAWVMVQLPAVDHHVCASGDLIAVDLAVLQGPHVSR